MRIIAEGFTRASISEARFFADYISADVISKVMIMSDEDSLRSEAYMRAMLTEVESLVKLLPSVSDDIITAARSIKIPAMLADGLSTTLFVLGRKDGETFLEKHFPEAKAYWIESR